MDSHGFESRGHVAAQRRSKQIQFHSPLQHRPQYLLGVNGAALPSKDWHAAIRADVSDTLSHGDINSADRSNCAFKAGTFFRRSNSFSALARPARPNDSRASGLWRSSTMLLANSIGVAGGTSNPVLRCWTISGLPTMVVET